MVNLRILESITSRGRYMETRYNVYFAGELLKGHDLASVRSNMGKLFNADDATLDKLFSGKPQLVKRNCDKTTALTYKQAMEQAGALPVIKTVPADTKNASGPAPGKAMTAAQRIAALAAAPDLAARQEPATPAAAQPRHIKPAEGDIGLAPSGTSVLLPDERAAPAISEVSTPDLEVFAGGQRLSDIPPTAPAPPDTSHLSTGAAGELLPNAPSSMAPLSPDTSAFELSPDGGDLSDCAAPAPAAPALDLSGIKLAPAGEDVLELQYRKKHTTPPPATEHLTLED